MCSLAVTLKWPWGGGSVFNRAHGSAAVMAFGLRKSANMEGGARAAIARRCRSLYGGSHQLSSKVLRRSNRPTASHARLRAPSDTAAKTPALASWSSA